MNNINNRTRAKAGIYLEENKDGKKDDKQPDKNDFWGSLKGGGGPSNDGKGPFNNPKNRLSFGVFIFILLTF